MCHIKYEILTQNINLFPMRDWHVKHMQDTIIKYLTGLPEMPHVGKKAKKKVWEFDASNKKNSI